MAEFCKKCFIEKLRATEDEIKRIVLTDFNDYCEGCGTIGKVVDHLADDAELNAMNEDAHFI